MANENLIHKIIIEGEVFTNYSEYSFIINAPYEIEPVRTGDEIVNLNSYKRFNIPELTFSFDYMPIEYYRKLMKLATGTKNELSVVCYDIINDIQWSGYMYFHPKEMANLLILVKGQSLEQQITTLATLGETFTMVSTNKQKGLIPIIFNANGGTVVDSPNGEGMYGEYFEMPSGNEFSQTGYLVDSYNTKADGTGISYKPNFILQITHPLELYVIWKTNTTFNLSFSYNVPSDRAVNPEWETSKVVTHNQPIGELPSPTLNDYTFDGWYWVIPANQPNLEDTRVNATDNFQYNYNAVCYGKWTKTEE